MNSTAMYDNSYTVHVLSLKNQVQNICDELSRYGEESAVLMVNPNNNVTGCMGSRFGLEFFQSKLDVLHQFHQYCQDCYVVQRIRSNLSYENIHLDQNHFHPHPMEMKNTSTNQNVYNKNNNGNLHCPPSNADEFNANYKTTCSMGNMNDFSNTPANHNTDNNMSLGNLHKVSNHTSQDKNNNPESLCSSVTMETTALTNGYEDQEDPVDQSEADAISNQPMKRIEGKGENEDNFIPSEDKESKLSGDNISNREHEISSEDKDVKNETKTSDVVKNKDSNTPIICNNVKVKSKESKTENKTNKKSKLKTENKKDKISKLEIENKKDKKSKPEIENKKIKKSTIEMEVKRHKKSKVKIEVEDSQNDDYMNETTDEETQVEARPKEEKRNNVKKANLETKSVKLSGFKKTRLSIHPMKESEGEILDKKKYTSRRLYTCCYCDKVYLTASRLTFHIRKMHAELMTKHTCNVCNESFTKPKGLSRHRVNQGHAQPCEICGKEFIHTPELKSHMRHHRAQQKKLEKIPIKCEFCPKEFWGKGDLNKHRRIHTKEKPYMCDFCGSQFALPSQLSCHRRSHTGERPYSCKECGKKFTLSNTLARHRRKHTGEKYQCHMCGKQYASRWNLTVHVEYIHTGLTPFKCEICGKEFNRKDNLKVHKKKHDKERAKTSTNTTMVPNSDVSADMYITGLVESAVQGMNDAGLGFGPKPDNGVGLGLVPKPEIHAHNQYYTY